MVFFDFLLATPTRDRPKEKRRAFNKDDIITEPITLAVKIATEFNTPDQTRRLCDAFKIAEQGEYGTLEATITPDAQIALSSGSVILLVLREPPGDTPQKDTFSTHLLHVEEGNKYSIKALDPSESPGEWQDFKPEGIIVRPQDTKEKTNLRQRDLIRIGDSLTHLSVQDLTAHLHGDPALVVALGTFSKFPAELSMAESKSK